MKLLRYGPIGQEIPCLLDDDGHIRDLSAHVTDFMGETVSLKSMDMIRALDVNQLPRLPMGARIGACLADVPNFYCIGLNYAKHAAETGSTLQAEPRVFNKATSALTGPFDVIKLPHGSKQTDWEVELGLVIGKPCYDVSQKDALDYVSAYFTCNDVSEREYQKSRSGQWVKGKSAPTFAPIGPYLVTPDEIADPQKLGLTTKVNGKTMQSSNTDDMIFNIRTIISKMSEYFELRTGDVIITGTPEGVGLGIKPTPIFLKPGDVVEVEVHGLGAQKMDVV